MDPTDNNTEFVNQKMPATIEGMAMAYISLVVMALLPIFFGSMRSVKQHRERKQLHQESGEKPEAMSHKDAAMFPLFASAALFALYVFFQVFSKEYINLLLTGYFFILGVFALCLLTSPVICSLVPAAIPNIPFHLKFTRGKGQHAEALINYEFNSYDLICLLFCSLFGTWYIINKHWIANNLFGIAFAINGVELLHLNKVVTGCILLCGLFVYDVFWVFGTNVMVTVAKSFDAPVKLVFPQDILENGFGANNFAMLGLGDIVIPGIFIALLLRFDYSLKRNSKVYFYTTFVAYFLGLVATICVMHTFKHAQPALLYLVPACLGAPLIMAHFRGDLSTMFLYEDHPSESNAAKRSSAVVSTTNTYSTKSRKNK